MKGGEIQLPICVHCHVANSSGEREWRTQEPMMSILVSAAWLKDNRNAPNQRIIDCSWEDRNFKHTFQVQPARAVGSLPASFP